VVLAVYWVPVLVGVRWGVWAGGDPLEIARSIGMVIGQDFLELPIATLALAPFVLAASVAAILAVRQHATQPREGFVADRLTVLFGLPYLLWGLYLAIVYVVFIAQCALLRHGSCFL
jgi:hypothetical protein